MTAPRVLAVGDLHIENFGTWRDREGRLIWGVNDFDEAYPFPYTNDLVRLAASAKVAIDAEHLCLKPAGACVAILEGYTDGLEAGGRPYVLAERHRWLGDLAVNKLRDPVPFWEKLQAFPLATKPIPREILDAIAPLSPATNLTYRFHQRVSGLGSLGRRRVVAIAEWAGGLIAREAKALVPSVCTWAQKENHASEIFYRPALEHAIRCPDPFVQVQGRWLIRRLSPHCSRIALTSLPIKRDEARLLYAMGWETANVHLGTKQARKAILKDLARRPAEWLRTGAKAMVRATVDDWKEWRGSEYPYVS